MTVKRRPFNEGQEIADLDRIDDLDEDMLFPGDVPQVPEEDLASLDETAPSSRKPSADMQGIDLPDSISGSSEQLFIRAGEDLFKVEHAERHGQFQENTADIPDNNGEKKDKY